MIEHRLDPEGLYLALGGGAARGFAHIGVLMAMNDHQIPIAGICGTSMGALIGACFALQPKGERIAQDIISYIKGTHFNQVRYSFMRKVEKEEKANRKGTIREKLRQGLLYGLSYTRGSVISFEDFRAEISAMVPDKTFKDTKIPFFATSVDLDAGKEVIFDKGFVRSAVMASSAIPGVFPAVKSANHTYVDGGWMNRVPVNPLIAFGGQRVVAVDVSDDPTYGELNYKRGFAVLNRANKLTRSRLHELQCEQASIILKPPVDSIHWADFVGVERIIEIGREYGESRIDDIKRLLEPPPKPTWRQRLARKLDPLQGPIVRNYSFEVRTVWDVKDAKIAEIS